MKTTVTVIAVKPFDWKGESVVPGQSLKLSPLDAIALAKKQIVTLTKLKASRLLAMAPPAPIPEPPPEPPPESPPEPPKRGRYRRRDLQAEDTTALVPEEPVPTPVAEDEALH